MINCLRIMELVTEFFFTVHGKYTSIYLFTMCSFFNNLVTLTGRHTMRTKNTIGNRNFLSKLPIVVSQISVIESEEFKENSNVSNQKLC